MDENNIHSISSQAKKDRIIPPIAKEDVEEAAKSVLDEASNVGKNTMTKICLTIVACSVVKTMGRIIIARNYAKKL